MTTPLRPGDYAWLAENDCFGTQCKVVILKIFKDGNVRIADADGKNLRNNHMKNLSATLRQIPAGAVAEGRPA